MYVVYVHTALTPMMLLKKLFANIHTFLHLYNHVRELNGEDLG
jgi:hypothetical protein